MPMGVPGVWAPTGMTVSQLQHPVTRQQDGMGFGRQNARQVRPDVHVNGCAGQTDPWMALAGLNRQGMGGACPWSPGLPCLTAPSGMKFKLPTFGGERDVVQAELWLRNLGREVMMYKWGRDASVMDGKQPFDGAGVNLVCRGGG